MHSSKHDAVYGFFILHFDVAVFKISVFLVGGLGDDDVEHLAELLEVLNDLLAGDRVVELVDEYLVVVVVSADVDAAIAHFHGFELVELSGCISKRVPISDSISK